MSVIEKYIGELLFDHDCVIVPTFGGFLAADHPAEIHITTGTIYPPYRKIAFNIFLKQNDGLLANHIVEFEKISYTDALFEIEQFVRECLARLDNGEKIELANIGTLYYDRQKNLQFENSRSVNYRRDAFGMEPVHFLPIQKEEKKLRPSVKLPVSRKYKKVLGIAAITAAAIWFGLNLYLISPKDYQKTSLNPFDSNLISKETNTIEKKSLTIPPAVVPETVYVPAAQPEELQPEKIVETPLVQPKSSVSVTPNTISASHFVVAGVFKVKDNAEKFLHEIRLSGYNDAFIIEANERHYVCYQSFDSQSSATKFADSVRTFGQEVWVWNK